MARGRRLPRIPEEERSLADNFIRKILFDAVPIEQQDTVFDATCKVCKENESYMGFNICQICMKEGTI